MKEEISAAVMFLTRLIGKSETLQDQQVETFKNCLHALLTERFQDHWFPEKPFKGQAYRCIRINETERRDPILEKAAQDCGLKYEDLRLPVELTIWVDPNEVCCRFGEHKGSYCTVASFKDGNKENFVDQINIDELEQKNSELSKQASLEILNRRKNLRKNGFSPGKSGYCKHAFSQQNILQQLPTLSPTQHFQTSAFPHSQPSYGSSPPSQFFPFSSSPPHHGSQPNSFYSRAGHYNNGSYSRYPSKFARNSTSYHNNYSTTTSIYSQHSSHNSHSSGGKNDRYHWVNKSVKA